MYKHTDASSNSMNDDLINLHKVIPKFCTNVNSRDIQLCITLTTQINWSLKQNYYYNKQNGKIYVIKCAIPMQSKLFSDNLLFIKLVRNFTCAIKTF